MSESFNENVYEVIAKCKAGEHTLRDFAVIIVELRRFRKELNIRNQKAIMEVLYNILLEQSEIDPKIKKKWAENNANYFSGNMVPGSDNESKCFSEKYKKIFLSREFDLSTIVKLIRDIIDNYETVANDYNLRIPEVVFRDDIVPRDKKKFKSIGNEIADALAMSLV